jgi:hypothetical protein
MYLVSFESNPTDNLNESTEIEEQRATTVPTFVNYFTLGIFFLSIILIGRRLKHQQPPPPSEVEQSEDVP